MWLLSQLNPILHILLQIILITVSPSEWGVYLFSDPVDRTKELHWVKSIIMIILIKLMYASFLSYKKIYIIGILLLEIKTERCNFFEFHHWILNSLQPFVSDCVIPILILYIEEVIFNFSFIKWSMTEFSSWISAILIALEL